MEEAREPAERRTPRRLRAWGFALAFLTLDSALLGWWWHSRPVEPPTVAGVVVDPEGRPMAARVHWMLAPDFRGTPTDDWGRFKIAVPARRDSLFALGAADAESAPLEFDGPSRRGAEDVVLRLRRPARLVGRLVDEAGLPMAGEVVYCRSGNSVEACLLGESTLSDADGHFEFESLAPGPAGLLTCRITRAFDLDEGARTEALVTLTADEAREHRRIKTIQDGLARRARERLR